MSRHDKRTAWTRWLTFLGGSVFGLLFDWEALLPALRHQPYAYGSHTDASVSLSDFAYL